MASEAQKRAVARYQAKNTKQYIVRLNKRTDKDLIDRLDSVDNKLGYIKRLIREDISKN